jgi:molecular chaperone DnaK (HSP70)
MADNKPVDHGKGLISGLPPGLPYHSPVEIVMSVDREGLLRVEAREPSSGRDLVIEVRVSVLSEEEIRRATDAVRGIAVRS